MRQLKNFKKSSCGTTDPEKLAKEAMAKYGSLNEDELVAKLTESVEKSKKDGTFNPEELIRFASMMAPYLSDSQRERMNNLINLLGSE